MNFGVSHVATLLWVCLLGEYASNDPTTPEERFALGYIYMEVEPAAPVSAEWLAGLVAVLRDHSGWGIGITNVREGYMLLFADRIMVTGPAFDGCRDAGAVLESLRSRLY